MRIFHFWNVVAVFFSSLGSLKNCIIRWLTKFSIHFFFSATACDIFHWMWSLALHKIINKFTYADTIRMFRSLDFSCKKNMIFPLVYRVFDIYEFDGMSHWVNNSSITFDLSRFACTANRLVAILAVVVVSVVFHVSIHKKSVVFEWLLWNFSLLTISLQNQILLLNLIWERNISVSYYSQFVAAHLGIYTPKT